MLSILDPLLLIINILVRSTSAQYYPNPYYQSMPQQYYYQAQQAYELQRTTTNLDYEEPPDYRRSSGKEYGSSGGRLPRFEIEFDDETDESQCSCNRCNNPKPQCREACTRCPGAQGGVVFVPYPYPLMLPGLIKNITTTTEQPTTRSTTVSTTTRAQPSLYDPYQKYTHNNGDKKYMLTSLRKTKPTWEPKYGIVPIPDNLAEKLMSQLRNVKELQARRF